MNLHRHGSECRATLAAACHDLVDGGPYRLDVDQARQLALAPWCYFFSGPGSAHRKALATDFANYWLVQQRRAEALMPLLNAWQTAGIHAVAIKGLAMSWGIYPHPAVRYCGDVDLLLDPEDAQRAGNLVVPGWRILKLPAQGENCAFVALHPASQTRVDAQFSVLPTTGFSARHAHAFTTQVLRNADLRVDLKAGQECITLPAPSPADLLLILAVNRAWMGSDAWRNKPHDYLDMNFTIQKHGLSPSDLMRRAQELGVQSTWLSFLRNCNPFERRFDLLATRYNRFERLRNDLSTTSSGLPPRTRMLLHRGRRSGRVLLRAAQAAPTLIRVLLSLRGAPSPAAAAAAAAASQVPNLDRDQPVLQHWEVAQAARWAHRLLTPLCLLSNAGHCVVYSLTLFRLLRQHGHDVHWCLGYRSVPGGPAVGHAWVEAKDPYAFGIEPHAKSLHYRVVFRTDRPDADLPALLP